MSRNISETAGWLLGYIIGIVSYSLSWLRRARVFHPQGKVYEARVINLMPDKLKFHHHAIVRVSGALWRKIETPDLLGVAIRFTPERRTTPFQRPEDQDLLFATFKSILKIPLAIFQTDSSDYLQDEFYSVLPYSTVNWEEAYFRLIPSHHEEEGGERDDRLERAIGRGKAWYLLQAAIPGEEWIALARIELIRRLRLDQEELAFNPFNRGLGIIPQGFIQHLRMGTYRLSAKGRLRAKKNILVTAAGRR